MKPLAIIFNDAHLGTGNEQAVIKSVRHMLKYSKEHDIKNIIFAGDLFHSRSFQRESVLQAFDEILKMIHSAGCTLYLFPGNHDKTIYESYDSFLDVYRYHPGVIFNREISDIEIDGVTITLLPFFEDCMLIPMIEEHPGSDVLISHFEMAGSTNLGRTSEKTSINAKLLSKWKKTYLGHFHNHHEITKDIVHLPSLRQSSFGEDSKKGFSVLFDDLSYELIQGDFKQFTKLVIDINQTTTGNLQELIKTHKDSKDTVRFEFIGDDEKLKALDKSMFQGTGIDVKLKYEAKYDYEDKNIVVPEIVKQYGVEEVKQSFEEFCIHKGLDHKVGIKLLNEFLKQE